MILFQLRLQLPYNVPETRRSDCIQRDSGTAVARGDGATVARLRTTARHGREGPHVRDARAGEERHLGSQVIKEPVGFGVTHLTR